MNFQGRLDAVAAHAVTGWVRDLSNPDRVVEVTLESEGEIVGSSLANLPRDDLRSLKLPGACGFAFSMHEVSVADPSTLKVRVAGEGWLIGEGPLLLSENRDERMSGESPAADLHPSTSLVRLQVSRHLAAQDRLYGEVEEVDRLLKDLRAVLARSVVAMADSPASADRLRAALTLGNAGPSKTPTPARARRERSK